MLRSVRDLEKFRVAAADGTPSGRIRDIYFDDQSWLVKHLVLSIEPRLFGRKAVLLSPGALTCPEEANGRIHLNLSPGEIEGLPPALTALPVCQQYVSMAFSSPGGGTRARALANSDPHLRSARAVLNYCVNINGQMGGKLVNFILEGALTEIRYLMIEQQIERKKLQFHILPQSVERFTWATERVLLRDLQPVVLAPGEVLTIPAEAA